VSAEARLLVRQQKGVAGRPWTQRLVLKGLGLRGPGSEVVVANDRAIRGMIRKVLHLVTVEEVGGASAAGAAPAAKAPAGAGSKSAGSKGSGSKAGTPAAKKVKS
jgi:large subunit ribosomal protein L30